MKEILKKAKEKDYKYYKDNSRQVCTIDSVLDDFEGEMQQEFTLNNADNYKAYIVETKDGYLKDKWAIVYTQKGFELFFDNNKEVN